MRNDNEKLTEEREMSEGMRYDTGKTENTRDCGPEAYTDMESGIEDVRPFSPDMENGTKDGPDGKKTEKRSNDIAGELQAAVVNAGGRALTLLDEGGYIAEKNTARARQARMAVNELSRFHYNIGFAGGQSSGKSTVVNAMIQYPLMPTCVQATTCTPVEILYSEKIRVLVTDDDTGIQVMDCLCDQLSEQDFKRLIRYTCAVSTLGAVENLQPFTDRDVNNAIEGLKPVDLNMDRRNPRHAAVLLLILLTVYVNQNQKELTDRDREVIRLREETLNYFGIKKSVINISILIHWDCPLLETGLKIIDLPGLGSNAGDITLQDGSLLKGHDTITKEAIARTDTMVFLNDPEITAAALPALKEMISNLSLREVVNPGNCIVPVLNKDDICRGDLVRQRALDDFSLMLVNAGIRKEPSDIWRCSAIYGEYAYLGIPDKTRTLYCMREASRERKKGRSEEKIQSRMEDWLEDLQNEYEHSGIEELRTFFRRDFIEKGKYEKSFTTIAALKALSQDSVAKLMALISADTLFAGAAKEMAEKTLDHLQTSANEPVTQGIAELSDLVYKKRKKAVVVEGLVDQAVSAYMKAFKASLSEYIFRNTEIAKALDISFLPGHRDSARVDKGQKKNYGIYQEFLDSSTTFHVSLSDVNKAYANALGYCRTDIEEIYESAAEKMKTFQKIYEGQLREKIRDYEGKADPDALVLLKNMVPVLIQFTGQVIDAAQTSIDQGKTRFRKIEQETTVIIMNKNDDFVRLHAGYLSNQVKNTAKGYIFDGHSWLRVKGEEGILNRLEKTCLCDADRQIIEGTIRNTCLMKIVNPINQWYADAETDINLIFSDLQSKIEGLFRSTRSMLNQNAEKRQEETDRHKAVLKEVNEIFKELKRTIEGAVRHALELDVNAGYEALVNSWFGNSEKEEDACANRG